MNKFLKNKNVLVLLALVLVIIASAYIYDAVRPKHNEFVSVHSMNIPRVGHSATLLKDGTVLIVGGETMPHSIYGNTKSAELFDPKTNKFKKINDMNFSRGSDHSATLLKDGRVFIVGGENKNQDCYSTAEIYDPNTKKFSLIKDNKFYKYFTSVLTIKDGNVFILGQLNDRLANTQRKCEVSVNTAQIYNPYVNKLEYTGKYRHNYDTNRSILLTNDNKIVIVGGSSSNSKGLVDNNNVEIYNLRTNQFATAVKVKNSLFSTILLNDGNLLITGGEEPYRSYATPDAEIYSISENKFQKISPMNESREYHSLIKLKNDNILVIGGQKGPVVALKKLNNAEIFDVKTQKFNMINSNFKNKMRTPVLTLLKDGRVLISGGFDKNNNAEVYIP